MATRRLNYGSDYQLLRYLGYHRNTLNQQILKATSAGSAVEWLDYRFAKSKPTVSRQWQGLAFLSTHGVLHEAWQKFWPHGSGIQNWDAAGWIVGAGRPAPLLVEAKAHLAELKSSCKATDPHAERQIAASLDDVKRALGVPADRDWMQEYYQYCNRIAALYFLDKQGIDAHLVFIYFYGDPNPWVKPLKTIAAWDVALEEQAQHVGLPENHPLSERIHKLFLPATADH
ncbi:MAG TPA: hypothetical protein VER55_02960 [Ardenticatenaceae bacterium]|nr:hypothetical protein [Ardenticatenaceae bacterium]